MGESKNCYRYGNELYKEMRKTDRKKPLSPAITAIMERNKG